MNTPRNSPDPEGMAIAREIQEKVRPAEIILGGSRAAGDHRPDSDVDLTAVAPDEAAAGRTEETLRELLEGKHDVSVVNDMTITREDFGQAIALDLDDVESRRNRAALYWDLVQPYKAVRDKYEALLLELGDSSVR